MDFSYTSEQAAAAALATDIFSGHTDAARLREIERSADRVDLVLWHTFCTAELLTAVLPEASGGTGLGALGASLLLREQGRVFAPVPMWPAVVATLLAARLQHVSLDDETRNVLLDSASGKQIVAVAFEEFGGRDPRSPRTTARMVDGAWMVDGEKAVVAFAPVADAVLVPASTPDGPGVFMVRPSSPGLRSVPVETTNLDRASNLTFDSVDARPVGRVGDGTADLLADLVVLSLSALQLGVAESAVARCATYVSTREQFGRPLGSLQAVQHSLADCYLDVAAMRITLDNAAWCIDAATDPADARSPVAVAGWWAADAGERVVHRVQHLHGGIGVDLGYPIHRNLLWGRQLANQLGSGAACLERLGELIATGGTSVELTCGATT